MKIELDAHEVLVLLMLIDKSEFSDHQKIHILRKKIWESIPFESLDFKDLRPPQSDTQ